MRVNPVCAKHVDLRRDSLVVILATKTPEKIEHLNIAARAQGEPITFLSLNEIRDAFVSAAEDTGDAYQNAHQKLDCVEDALALCRSPGIHRDVLKRLIEVSGIAFDPDRVLFASEDSTMDVPADVWKIVRRKLASFVSEDILKRAEGEKGRVGMGAETGPILGAVGIPRFMRMVSEAAELCGYGNKPIPFVDKADFLYRRLSDLPESPRRHIKTTADLCLTPRGMEIGDRVDAEGEFVLTWHYLSHQDHPNLTLVENHHHHLSFDSPRAGVVPALAAAFEIPSLVAPRLRVVRAPKKMNVVEVDLTPPSVPKGAAHWGHAYYDYLNITPLMESADAFVFKPFDARDLVQKRWAYHKLFAVMEAKQIEAPHMNKPIILLDNGCWSDARRLEIILTNHGLIKNYFRHSYFDAVPFDVSIPHGTAHYPTCYADYVIGTSLSDLKRVQDDILMHRARTYNRYESPGDLRGAVQYCDDWPEDVPCCVAACTSATSDNKRLVSRNQSFGRLLAEQGKGLVYGGGDEHAMGGFYNGYLSVVGPLVAGFSTPSIVKTETKNGCLPPCHVWGLSEDLSTRRTHFATMAHAYYVTWGGIGTLVEKLSFAVLYDAFHSFRDRTMIVDAAPIHGKDGVLNPLASPGHEIIYGKTALHDHRALCKAHGILVSTSMAETKRKLLEIWSSTAQRPAERRIWKGPTASVVCGQAVPA